jgi:5-methyltetrahydrofolate--homocysteine methyltransferase
VALTLDENGIPATAQGRVDIARKILETAAAYGIDRRDLIFDTLTMTVSTDPLAARVTLEALRRIRSELGCRTTLGVSNVSFGLPARDTVNSTFFALALQSGLSAAIMNPYSGEMMGVWHAYRALSGYDENCADYIAYAADLPTMAAVAPATAPQAAPTASGEPGDLRHAVCKGLREQAGALAKARLAQGADPMALVREDIIPALDEVGRGFEQKTVYLPQLLMSAEAARAAAEQIKAHMSAGAQSAAKTGYPVVIATVHGDIHDIGKNIVKLLLENYGFAVTDLGKDVPPERIVEAVVRLNAPLCGLSALMTTTVPAMEETIRQLRVAAPDCRIMVGGAVLNEEYAARIGADFYGSDAMEAVRYAERVCKN